MNAAEITAAFTTPTMGLNARAAALAATVVSQFESPTTERAATIQAERGALFNELRTLKQFTKLGADNGADHASFRLPARSYSYDGEHAVLAGLVLTDILAQRLAGMPVTASVQSIPTVQKFFVTNEPISSEGAFDAEEQMTAAVARFEALGVQYASAAITA
jgi:hypothetical protein